MARTSKHYYLYKFLLWTVVVESDEVEVEESYEGSGEALTAHLGQPGEMPDFGFTAWTPHWVTEEDE